MRVAFILWYQSVMRMLARYRRVFRRVWAERKQTDPQERLQHEMAFLPAHLELQESPVSPAPRVTMALIISFSVIAVIWAIFGKIDMVATAQGKLVPSDGTKVIQPLETSVVKAIRVTNGQAVKAGDVLIELDSTMAVADIMRSSNDVTTMRLQAARARAFFDSVTSPNPPRMEPVPGASPERQAQEQRILDAQNGEFKARLARIDAEIAKREAELRSTREVVHKLEQTAPLARQRAADYKDLVDKKFISKHGYLDKEVSRIEQEGDLATQKSRLQELAAALQEIRAQRFTQVAETRRIALDSLNESEQRGTSFGQDLVKSQTRGRLMTLIAPVDGTIQQLVVRTVGGVVTPAQTLMMVVPTEAAVEVEAFLENKDIGFVHVGQIAEIKIETFPFTKYGIIDGKVTQVSNDSINDERRGLIYAIRARMDKTTLQVEGNNVNLTPGMAVTVEVKTGQRRIIEYFLSPLITHATSSLRER